MKERDKKIEGPTILKNSSFGSCTSEMWLIVYSGVKMKYRTGNKIYHIWKYKV